MTPQEKELITTLLARLKSAGGQPKDPEADALIRQAMAEQPDMPYYLVQTVLIQDLSLQNAQNLIAELERQLAKTRSEAATAAGVAGGALLFQGISSLFGNHYAGGLMGAGMTPGLGETVVNNYYGSEGGSDFSGGAAGAGSDYSNSDYAGGSDYSNSD